MDSSSGARRDRTRRNANPGALTLLVRVRVQSFLLRSIGKHAIGASGVDQSNVTKDSDMEVMHSEILKSPWLSKVLQGLRVVRTTAAGHSLSAPLNLLSAPVILYLVRYSLNLSPVQGLNQVTMRIRDVSRCSIYGS
jgi:hypothetical protein